MKIESLMGAAISIGMQLSDFFILTPTEFAEVWRYNIDRQKNEEYDRWNMMRYHATIMLQPNLKKGSKLTPEKLLPLEGDKKLAAPVVSKEERKRRLKKRLEQIKSLSAKEGEGDK